MQKNKSFKTDESFIILRKNNSQTLIANNPPLTLIKNREHAYAFSSLENSPIKNFQCHSEKEVVDAVNWVRDKKLRFTSKMCAEEDRPAFIDLSKLNHISIDKSNGIAKVQGGALVSQMDRHTYPLGMAVPAGMVSYNRVADLLPLGGQNILMNQYGFTVDHLQSVEMVLADGSLIQAFEAQNQDLFIALKGGGKVFGIITSMEFKMQPIEKENVGGMLIYPMRIGKKVISSYRKYAMLSPNEMSVSLLFLTLANGLKAVGVHSAWVGNKKEGMRQLGIFQGLIEPLADFTQMMPYYKLQKGLDPYLAGVPRENKFSGYFSELSPELIEELLFFAEKIGSNSRVLINALKGATLSLQTNNKEPATNWYIEIIPKWENSKGKDLQIEWAASFWEAISSHTHHPGWKEIKPQSIDWDQVINKYDPDHFFG
ncbi:MAG: FAD-binding protein [Cyclobacteriaceae bacterium]